MQRHRSSTRKSAVVLAAAIVLYLALGSVLHEVGFPEAEAPEWAQMKAGDAFETPTGERIQVIRGRMETGAEFTEAHFDIDPGGHAAFDRPSHPPGNLGPFFGQLSGLDFNLGFLQMMLFMPAYDVYPGNPPPVVMQVISFLPAPTARLLGYPSFYPAYAERFLEPAAQRGSEAAASPRALTEE